MSCGFKRNTKVMISPVQGTTCRQQRAGKILYNTIASSKTSSTKPSILVQHQQTQHAKAKGLISRSDAHGRALVYTHRPGRQAAHHDAVASEAERKAVVKLSCQIIAYELNLFQCEIRRGLQMYTVCPCHDCQGRPASAMRGSLSRLLTCCCCCPETIIKQFRPLRLLFPPEYAAQQVRRATSS